MSNHSASFDLSQPTHEEDEDVEAELEKMSMPRQAAFVPGLLPFKNPNFAVKEKTWNIGNWNKNAYTSIANHKSVMNQQSINCKK